MKHLNLIALVILFSLGTTLALQVQAANLGSFALLEKALEDEQKSVTKLNEDTLKALEETHNISIRKLSPDVVAQTLTEQKSRVQTLLNKKKEQLLRLRFLTDLIARIKRISGSTPDSKAFKLALLELSLRDVIGSLETNIPPELWEFNMNLSIALGDLLEPFEDPVAFILDYMEWSSVSSPRNPADYILEARNYRGGNILNKPAPSATPESILPEPTADPVDEGYER